VHPDLVYQDFKPFIPPATGILVELATQCSLGTTAYVQSLNITPLLAFDYSLLAKESRLPKRITLRNIKLCILAGLQGILMLGLQLENITQRFPELSSEVATTIALDPFLCNSI